jgi:hypothetical protein
MCDLNPLQECMHADSGGCEPSSDGWVLQWLRSPGCTRAPSAPHAHLAPAHHTLALHSLVLPPPSCRSPRVAPGGLPHRALTEWPALTCHDLGDWCRRTAALLCTWQLARGRWRWWTCCWVREPGWTHAPMYVPIEAFALCMQWVVGSGWWHLHRVHEIATTQSHGLGASGSNLLVCSHGL